MSLTIYIPHNFKKDSLAIIEKANEIIAEYQQEGYDLTVRQLYYQFVARDFLPNCKRSYDKLGKIISDARLAGLIDWETIVDRTRPLHGNDHYRDPSDILRDAARRFKLDTRATQDTYVEVWVEKEALVGVIAPVCRRLDVHYLACKGYLSQSAMYRASQRMLWAQKRGQQPVVIHLGDHDPSGIDMTRDLQDRLRDFHTGAIVERIALNMDQVEKYSPPPNFAKITDSRFAEYVRKYGKNSWELDALDPKTISRLIEDTVGQYTDHDKRQVLIEEESEHKQRLAKIADDWK